MPRVTRVGVVARGIHRKLPFAGLATVIGAAVASAALAGDVSPASGVEGERDRTHAVTASILPRIDAVLEILDARIQDIRAQAERMLEHADTAVDSDQQMRFEEMYGRLAAAAEELEAERGQLRSMRDELANDSGTRKP